MPRKTKKKREVEAVRSPWLARIPWLLLVFLLATQPLVFSPWNTEYGYTKSIYTLVLVSLILIFWVWELLRTPKAKVELSWLSPILPALLLAAFLSLTGQTPTCVILQSAALILFFGLIFILVLNAPEHYQPWILGALVFSAFGNALFALLQYLGIAPGGPGGKGPGAMIATMGNQQFLAGFLSYLIFPGLILFRAKKAWPIAALTLGFNFAVLLLTQQIGVRLGLGAAFLFIAFGLGFWEGKLPSWEKLAVLAILGLAALGGTLGFSGLDCRVSPHPMRCRHLFSGAGGAAASPPLARHHHRSGGYGDPPSSGHYAPWGGSGPLGSKIRRHPGLGLVGRL
jgi:hypothetical protein